MIATWMVYVFVISLLLGVAARGTEELLRALHLPLRFAWLAGLVGMLALAAAAPLRGGGPTLTEAPPLAAEVDETEIAAAAPAASRAATEPGRFARLMHGGREVLRRPLAAAGGRVAALPDAPLLTIWLALSLTLMLLGSTALARARAGLRRWPRRTVEGVEVRLAPREGPAVLGFVAPQIVLPAWLLDAPVEKRRLVVLHEEEHLRARDPLALAAGCLSVLLLPWNPAAWWMLRRLRIAVEVDCDARVLRGGVPPLAYGNLLLEMAGRGLAPAPAALALSESAHHLERRLNAMRTNITPAAAMRGAACGFLGIAALLAACGAELPTSAQLEEMDVAAAEAQAQRLMLLRPDAEGVTYTLDGAPVSAEEARSLPADRIALVEVVRSGGEGRVRLLTPEGAAAVEAGVMTLVGEGAGEERRRRVLYESVQRQGEAYRLRASEGAEGEVVLVEQEGQARLSIQALTGFAGLVVLDGAIIPASELRGLDLDRINSISVLKGEAARLTYSHPRAAHGVIQITTEDGTR